MKFNIDLDPKIQPDEVGEILRRLFFNMSDGKYGCYSTFEVNKEVTELTDFIIEDEFGEFQTKQIWKRYIKVIDNVTVEMRYYWDGDGTLIFIFLDKTGLINDDCKKDYNWEWHENVDKYFASQF